MTTDQNPNRNREAWLTDVTNFAIVPKIRKECGLSPLKPLLVSVGFPASGGTRRKDGRYTDGQCCMQEHKSFHHLFIHPAHHGENDEAIVAMVGTLMHEVLHGCLPMDVGHRKDFSQAAKALGLLPEGAKPKSTRPDDDCARWILSEVEKFGPYPHESFEVSGKKQTTRLIQVKCPICKYVARVTRTWLDGPGAPICPDCDIPFEENVGDGDPDSIPLTPMEQIVEYGVKATLEVRMEARQKGIRLVYDPRWSLRMIRRGRRTNWYVLDYGPEVSGKFFTITRDDGTTEQVQAATLGVVPVRLQPAESRSHAIAVLEALRDGRVTHEKLDADRDDDPALDIDPDSEYEDDDDEEIYDGVPYTDEEMEIYEQEVAEREGGRAKVTPITPMTEGDLPDRIAQLTALATPTRKRR